jgi:hypothetical protein
MNKLEELLDRYRTAATAIASATIRDLLGSDPANDEGVQTDAIALEEMLQRQAKLLIKHHDKRTQRNGGNCAVDETLLQRRLADIGSIAMSKFYAYRYDLLPHYWRQIYCDSLILTTHYRILQIKGARSDAWVDALDEIVEKLDRAVIVAGGAGKMLGPQWIEQTLDLMEQVWISAEKDTERPRKRVKQNNAVDEARFSDAEPHGRPNLSQECPRYSGWSILQFEDYINQGDTDPKPIVFTDLIKSWPALQDSFWCKPGYLLSKTFGGRRLVPVEVGRSYVDEGWGQELISFKDYLKRYVDPTYDGKPEKSAQSQPEIGYLAQHNLFRQIPALRNDIQVPDLCWADVPGHPTDASKNQAPVDVPQLNAWFGPAKTITPLHTDGYHNLLCQVVGTKYVRLYPPSATMHMRPRAPEHGVDMSNTSELDVGTLEGWDSPDDDTDEETLEKLRNDLTGVEYRECILGPGDTLLIPIGWWHYVRSLSISFSVSFWWN